MTVPFPSLFYMIFGLISLVIFWGFGITSWKEGETRAATRSFLVGLGGFLVSLIIQNLPQPLQGILALLSVLLILAALIIFFLPVGHVPVKISHPTTQFDEREIMFARDRLEPGSPEFEAYYASHPKHKIEDDKTRRKPGLLSPYAQLTDPLHSAATEASFQLTESLRNAVDGTPAEGQQLQNKQEITANIKSLAKFYGALDVGITRLKPVHVYSHVGRGSGEYGSKIHLDHSHAVAFTVEMDFKLTRTAPHPPETLETGRQYVHAAVVAVQLASAIRNLGFPARAHIDGNYRVIAPLVARDAGLGEIGRMGILMTPQEGPRVRLGLVTTSLALETDSYVPDQAVIDFCRICKKCSENCPSQSIPYGDRQHANGALRWKINPDTCFRYWNVVGTDCGRCMAVCPFSHPDTFFHNAVRWGILRSGAFRRFALWMDDFFYGKEPQRFHPQGDVLHPH